MVMGEMKRGDHIYVKTKIPRVSHHGIYCGNEYAIHFDGHTKSIAKSSLSDFAQPFDISCIKIVDYRDPLRFLGVFKVFDGFLKSRALPDDVNAVMERAESLLGKSQYDLGRRNCEHFAVWCKTKKWRSPQINNALGQFLRLVIQSSLALAVIPWPTNLVIALIVFFLSAPPLLSALNRASKPPS